jgi:hypothetical protein
MTREELEIIEETTEEQELHSIEPKYETVQEYVDEFLVKYPRTKG